MSQPGLPAGQGVPPQGPAPLPPGPPPPPNPPYPTQEPAPYPTQLPMQYPTQYPSAAPQAHPMHPQVFGPGGPAGPGFAPQPPRAPWYRRPGVVVPIVAGMVVVVGATIGLVAWSGRDESDGADVSAPQDEEAAAAEVTVPDVTGMTRAEARAALVGSGLVLGEVDGEGEVVDQSPAAGARVDEGSAVDLTLDTPEADGAGTFEDPLPAGTELVGVDDSGRHVVTIVLERAIWDADDAVAAANPYNDPPPAGSTYVVLPVTVTNIASTEPVAAWWDVDIWYVTPDGRELQSALHASMDEDMTLQLDIELGQTQTGTITFAIPDDAFGGVWAVSYDHSDLVYVAAE